jgi:hypothetical protein
MYRKWQQPDPVAGDEIIRVANLVQCQKEIVVWIRRSRERWKRAQERREAPHGVDEPPSLVPANARRHQPRSGETITQLVDLLVAGEKDKRPVTPCLNNLVRRSSLHH